MYCLDRFEGEYAIIEYEDDNGVISYIKENKSVVSPQVKEGEVLKLENGMYIADKELTEQRRKQIQEKLKHILG